MTNSSLKNKPRVLFVLSGSPRKEIGGGEIYGRNLMQELAKTVKTSVVYREKDEDRFSVAHEKNLGIDEFYFKDKRIPSVNQAFRDKEVEKSFTSVLDYVKPNIIHFQHWGNWPVSLYKMIKRRGINSVLTFHDFWHICPRHGLIDMERNICEGRGSGLLCAICSGKKNRARKRAYKVLKPICNSGLSSAIDMAVKKTNMNSRIKTLVKRREVMRKSLGNIDLFIARSEFVKNRYTEFDIDQNKIITLPLSSSVKEKKGLKKKPSKGTIRFGFFGRIEPIKGIDVLIKAFNELSEYPVTLKIYGDYSSKLRSRKYHKKLLTILQNPNISFQGPINHNRIEEAYREIDILVVPSLWQENSPLTITEAFLFKTPIIASNIESIAALVNDERNGFLFKAGDAASLRKKVLNLVESPEMIQKLTSRIPKVYSISKKATLHKNLYEEILKDTRFDPQKLVENFNKNRFD